MNNIEIPKPNRKEEFFWAKVVKIRSDWLRKNLPNFDIDTEKFLLGEILETIIGDDSNCFGPSFIPFNPENSHMCKKNLEIRLRWEMEMPETPSEIKERLEEFFPKIEETNWQDKEEFEEIKNAWKQNIREFVSDKIKDNEKYQEALAYASEKSPIISDDYDKFLYDK